MKITIVCKSDEEEKESIEVENWIHDGEFDSKIEIKVERDNE